MSAKAEEYDEQEAPPNPPPAPSGYDLGRQWTETIFPMKLYDILCNPEFHHAISWMPHGRSWKVLNKDFFMEEICPQYFAQTRYESFIRQVNGWGFKRMRREGPDRSSYYHEHFLRGYPNLIDHMRRPAPGEKSRDLREEPDFYSLNPMPPLPTPPPRDPNSRNSQAKKAGRPLGSVTSHLAMPRAHSSFDAVTPRSDPMAPPGAHPYPYPMQPGAPWTGAPQWPGYPGYPPPPAGYWAQPPPMHAAQFRPPGYPPGYPMAWPQQPPGAPGQAAMMPYPYQMYDPSQYYAAYPQAGQPGAPPQPSTPQSGVNVQGAGASSSGSRRSRDDGDQSQDEQEGSASKRQRSSGDASHGPPAHPLSAGEAQYPQAGAAGLPPGMPPGMMYQHPMYMANPAMMQQQQQHQESSGGNVAPFSPIRPGHPPQHPQAQQDPSQQHQQQPPPRHPQQQGQGQRQQPGPNEYESYNHPPGNNGAPPGAGGYGGYNDMERNL